MIEFEISTNFKQIDFDITQGIPKYVPANFQSKTVIPTTEQQVVRADKPYDGLEQVTVEPIKILDKTITQNGEYSANEENIDGYSSVFVNVQPNLQEKSITITENCTTEVVADSGYDGLAKVSVEANVKDNDLLNVIKGLTNSSGDYPIELTADMFEKNTVYIDEYQFYNNKNIIKVSLPENKTTIKGYCFYNCTNLQEVVGANLKIGSDYMFYGCNQLRKNPFQVMTNTYKYMFYDCTNLQEVIISSTYNGYINQYAFYNCRSLKRLDFHNVTEVGFYSCTDCISLEYVKLGRLSSRFGSIRRGAFSGCRNLKVVDFRDSQGVNSLAEVGCFSGVPTTCKFIIPDNLYDSWITATNWASLYASGYQFVKASEYTEA